MAKNIANNILYFDYLLCDRRLDPVPFGVLISKNMAQHFCCYLMSNSHTEFNIPI